nr:MAG: hypothetical protein [Molluscum contagiosum virus]
MFVRAPSATRVTAGSCLRLSREEQNTPTLFHARKQTAFFGEPRRECFRALSARPARRAREKKYLLQIITHGRP